MGAIHIIQRIQSTGCLKETVQSLRIQVLPVTPPFYPGLGLGGRLWGSVTFFVPLAILAVVPFSDHLFMGGLRLF